MTTDTQTAFAGLLDEVAATHARMVQQLADDETTLLEAHKWILSILQVAADVQLWADTARPRFVDIAGPYKKWGGDNADAFYRFAPIDPTRTYRITVWPGDAAYLSLTVYGGPNDGRYSERIVGTANSRDASPGPDGGYTDCGVARAAHGGGYGVDQAGARRRCGPDPRLPEPPHGRTTSDLAHRGGRTARDVPAG